MLLLLLVELVDERGDEAAIVVAKNLYSLFTRKTKQNALKARNRRRGYIFARFRWEIP